MGIQFITAQSNIAKIWEIISRGWGLFLILIAYQLIKVITAVIDPQGMLGLYMFLKIDVFTDMLLMFLVLYFVRDFSDFAKIIDTLIIASLVVTLIVVVESVVQHNLFDTIISDTNWSVDAALLDKSRDDKYRAQGSFGHPIILAQYAVCLLPLAWWRVSQLNGLKKLLFGIAIVGLGADVFLTNTRSGIGLLVIALFVLGVWNMILWWKRNNQQLVKMLIAVQLGGAAIVLLGLMLRFMSNLLGGRTQEESMSSYHRVQMWHAAIPKIMESPLSGYGPTNAMTNVGFVGHFGNLFMDNYFLLLSLESGLIATFLLVIIFLYLSKDIFLLLFAKLRDEREMLRFALSLSIGLFAVFQVIHASSELFRFFYLLAGCKIALDFSKNSDTVLKAG